VRDAHPFHNKCRASAGSAVDYSADIALETEGGMTMKVKARTTEQKHFDKKKADLEKELGF
jgi:hypothetical protein